MRKTNIISVFCCFVVLKNCSFVPNLSFFFNFSYQPFYQIIHKKPHIQFFNLFQIFSQFHIRISLLTKIFQSIQLKKKKFDLTTITKIFYSKKKIFNQIIMQNYQPPQDQNQYIERGNTHRLSHILYNSESDSDEEGKTDTLDLPETKLNQRISCNQVPTVRSSDVEMDHFEKILTNNLIWSQENLEKDPDYFNKLKDVQTPQYLWIGCSDSRVPANQVVGLLPGELFVHRNIANQAPLSDINALAVIQFAVQVLKVKDIIVCGHYGCGGIKAAFKKHDHGPLQAWLSYIRDLRARYRKQLISQDQTQNQSLLIQLNVKHNVQNIARVPIIQKTWTQGKQLRIHGLVYRLEDGILNDLQITIDSINQLPQQYRIY